MQDAEAIKHAIITEAHIIYNDAAKKAFRVLDSVTKNVVVEYKQQERSAAKVKAIAFNNGVLAYIQGR